MTLRKDQYERYERNIRLELLGEAGQERLLQGKVLLIGTGGLGSPAALYLAAAGIGTLGLVDADAVDLSNLQRQILHSQKTVGVEKVLSARERLNGLNRDVHVVTYAEKALPDTLPQIIADRDYDFVIDATDNFTAKFLINDTCVAMKKPFSHAGVLAFHGQTMTYVPGQGPCYRCLFEEEPKAGDVPTSKEVGILGAVAGLVGTLQATEAIKYIAGVGELLTGTLLTYDALSMQFRRIAVPRNPDCQACGGEG